MKNERNIEHIFKDKLQELEVSPPEHLWANISQEITPKKEQKKPFLFWYIGGGIAASFLIFTTLFFNFYSTPNNNNTIVFLEDEYCPEERIINKQEDVAISKQTDNINSEITPTINKTPNNTNRSLVKVKNPIANPSSKLIEPIEINHQKHNISNSYAFAEVPKITTKENTKLITEKVEEKSIIKTPNNPENENLTQNQAIALLNPENEKEETKKEKQKRWSLQPQLATFAYNSTSNDSSINSNFKNNPQDTETDLSYGIRIAYQATPKISIRTGVSNANINVTTGNIGTSTSSNNSVGSLFSNSDISFVNLNPSPTINSGNFVSEEISEEIEAPDSDGDEQEDTVNPGNISQQIQYIEIPIEIAYKLLDKKIGIDIIGGLSTFLLSKNESAFESETNSTALGETSSLNNTSFSSNIGFSIDYSLIKNLKFSIEPMLKLQLNSFDNTTNYQPYFLGISSGLKWNF